jgi:hypothetical protein
MGQSRENAIKRSMERLLEGSREDDLNLIMQGDRSR